MRFIEALNSLKSLYEGGYANLKGDKGGESYNGIAENYYPDWQGWKIINSYKKLYPQEFTFYLKNDKDLQNLVKLFYKQNYWDVFKGDELPYIVAEELLEQSVNQGTGKLGGERLQEALNLLNRNERLYPDLKVDGIVGKKTLDAVKKVNIRRLVKVLNGLQFMRYYNLDKKNPENERFVGWFDRV